MRRTSTPSRHLKKPPRPRGPHDQRTRSATIFGAICLKEGKGTGLVLPFLQFRRHDAPSRENIRSRRPRRPCRPGHGSGRMAHLGQARPARLTLPPRSPELNPVGNVWQFLRDNWLSNRVFTSHYDILNHCCDAWNKLIAQPWKIMFIGHRNWAHRL